MKSKSEGDAPRLFEQAKEACTDWPAEQGVLFILELPDHGSMGDLIEQRTAFWSAMNLQREHWGSLACHVIFFLYTGKQGGFRMFLTVADHLASWTPLKFHLPEPRADRAGLPQSDMPASFSGTLSPKVARSRLESLGKELEVEHAAGRLNPPNLTRRYYIPMLEAALSTGDLNRAQALRARVGDNSDQTVLDSDLPRWWNAVIDLDLRLWQLDAARKTAETMLARSVENTAMQANAMKWLGRIAAEQRDFPTAEGWYRKSLAIEEKQGNEHGAAFTYHHLGIIAQEQRDFPTAENWYRKSLSIEEKQGNEHGAAATYHNLGMIAQAQRDFTTAEGWYRKSLAIKEEQDDEHGAAFTYHQLGMIAQAQRDFTMAEGWYRKSLAIKEEQDDEHGAASTYHQLGMLAQAQRDFTTAEDWYRKALAIKEKQGNEHGTALTLSQPGLLNRGMGNLEQSGEYLLMGARKFTATEDAPMAGVAIKEYLQTLAQSPADVQAELRRLCREYGLEELVELAKKGTKEY